jgi:hypothetical protein
MRACGGDYKTPVNYHPWRLLPKNARTQIGAVKMNLTLDVDPVSGFGGTGHFALKYTCRKDLCVKSGNALKTVFQVKIIISSSFISVSLVFSSFSFSHSNGRRFIHKIVIAIRGFCCNDRIFIFVVFLDEKFVSSYFYIFIPSFNT